MDRPLTLANHIRPQPSAPPLSCFSAVDSDFSDWTPESTFDPNEIKSYRYFFSLDERHWAPYIAEMREKVMSENCK